MRVTRLRPGRKYCVLSRMAEECGWKYKDLVERLEAGRNTAIAP
jgi:large subunit ribosomal protein L13Ae